MQKILLILFIFYGLQSFSQNKNTDKIVEEGKLLFRLEKGSWYGTDDMLARFSAKKDSIGGYFSYETMNKQINTIFFSQYDPSRVLIRYTFDYQPTPNPVKIDTVNSSLTSLEQNLISIRQDARNKASENSDNFFTFYENTSLNFIPVINGKERKVFILTGPQRSGMVILGNDYVLTYGQNNKFKNKNKIHTSILQFPYHSEKAENSIKTTIHSHIDADYISSTDICTLLLYKDFVEWDQHIVISEKRVSIFNLVDESLFTMKRKDWEKIYKSK